MSQYTVYNMGGTHQITIKTTFWHIPYKALYKYKMNKQIVGTNHNKLPFDMCFVFPNHLTI
jgi:hypothetical protein